MRGKALLATSPRRRPPFIIAHNATAWLCKANILRQWKRPWRTREVERRVKIKLKRAYEPPNPGDGFRVLVTGFG
jgi:hypothetical protein